MPHQTSVTTDVTGRRVLAKLAHDAEEATRLAQEATSLEAGQHPGVVELVGMDGQGVGAILLTAHVDGPSLAEVGPQPMEEGVAVLAAVARTLADLHDLGLVHGAVCPDHVVLGRDRRPILCSLGYGGEIGAASRSLPVLGPGFADPSRVLGDRLEPSIDVYGLGALARFLAPDAPPDHVLARTAVEAATDDRSARPSARLVAATLQQAASSARRRSRPVAPGLPDTAVGLARDRRPDDRPDDRLDALRRGRRARAGGRRRRHPRAAGALAASALAGLLVVALGIVAVGRRGSEVPGSTEAAPPATEVAPPPVDEASSGPATTRAGTASSTTAPARRDCPPVTGLLQADVDGDGCPDALRYADGILDGGGSRWSLGQVGDQVVTGDWGCQGTRTLALFRPATGELVRFDGWAAPGRDLAATPVAVVTGGIALRAADVDHDGCHEVVVERPTGPAEIVRMPTPRP